MVQKIGRGGNEGGEGKEEKEEEEEEEKEEDEEEDEEDEEEDKEDEEDEQEEEDEAKRREEGRGGGSLSKISSEETLSKLRLKLNQNKAKSTKHAGRPADFSLYSKFLCLVPPPFGKLLRWQTCKLSNLRHLFERRAARIRTDSWRWKDFISNYHGWYRVILGSSCH